MAFLRVFKRCSKPGSTINKYIRQIFNLNEKPKLFKLRYEEYLERMSNKSVGRSVKAEQAACVWIGIADVL